MPRGEEKRPPPCIRSNPQNVLWKMVTGNAGRARCSVDVEMRPPLDERHAGGSGDCLAFAAFDRDVFLRHEGADSRGQGGIERPFDPNPAKDHAG